MHYEIGQFRSRLNDLQEQRFTGVAYIEAKLDADAPKKRSRVLAFRDGMAVYGGLELPSPRQLAETIGQKLHVGIMDTAIQFAVERVKNPNSAKELLNIIIKTRVVRAEGMIRVLRTGLLQTLEQLLPHAGEMKLAAAAPFDFYFDEPDRPGFAWDVLEAGLGHRQQMWKTLSPAIPSMEGIPRLLDESRDAVSSAAGLQKLKQWVDGKRSLVEIAEQLDRDPLDLANDCLPWVQTNRLAFWQGTNNTASVTAADKTADLPVVLSVDDSAIVRTKIAKALGDRYRVLLAANAMDALHVMNSNKISLLLLDVTMPDVDGLEFCRTVRSIPKFKHLPVVMLTAKEGLVDKLKGQIAGTTHYLNKSVDRDTLLKTIARYIPSQAPASV